MRHVDTIGGPAVRERVPWMVVSPPVHQVPDVHQHLHGPVLQLPFPCAKCSIVDWSKVWECVLEVLPDVMKTGESRKDGRRVTHIDNKVVMFVFPMLRERTHNGGRVGGMA